MSNNKFKVLIVEDEANISSVSMSCRCSIPICIWQLTTYWKQCSALRIRCVKRQNRLSAS